VNRLALMHVDVAELGAVLRQAEPRETGAFFLLREGRGVRGRRFLAVDPIFPTDSAWEDQQEGRLRPKAQWISAAISKAANEGAGLLFVHSHPDPGHPLGFSPTDRSALAALGGTISPILDGPFAAAVVHPEGWAAAVIEDDELTPIERIVAVDRTIRVLSPLRDVQRRRATDLSGLDDRQRDALGTVHEILQDLDVAVVGVGGIGSPVAEQFVRMGVGSMTLVDHDVLDTPSNVRRVVGSSPSDLRATTPRPKVDVVGAHLDRVGLGVTVRRVCGDVRKESVFRELLDVDVVICATDSHGSRGVINDLASVYLLPVIDVGVQAGAKRNADLAALVAEVAVLTPVTPCLWCRRRISGDVIRAENLPEAQREKLVREDYLVGGVGEPAPSVTALTSLGGGLATCALLSLLTREGDVCPSGYWVDGLMGDSGETLPLDPTPTCRCRDRLGGGDSALPSFLPED
jgi:hypothetical protein